MILTQSRRPRLFGPPAAAPDVALVLWTTTRAEAELRCRHLPLMRRITAGEPECAQCAAREESWVSLRLCSSCGHVACCEKSKHDHAARHFRESGHPVVEALGLGRAWWFCYPDQIRVFA